MTTNSKLRILYIADILSAYSDEEHPLNSTEIIDLLKLSNEKYKQTIIMITHDMNLAKFANRIITLEDGHIVKDEKIK